MLATTESIAIVGTEARLVQVEAHVSNGLPRFSIVGLPAKSVKEAEQRVRAATLSSDLAWPDTRIVANLAPADLRKEGGHFDLAMAVAIAAAEGSLERGTVEGSVFAGELALDGEVRPVPGVIAAAIAARAGGRKALVCPAANASEAALVEGVCVVPVARLSECIGYLKGEWSPPEVVPAETTAPRHSEDMAEVRGHEGAKRAAEIAAAGGHNILLVGSPGSGKTMLARRLPGILPEMSIDEALEVTRIFSVAGLLGEKASLIAHRPFRSPHHGISPAGLIGGGTGMVRPGEISLAHNGVLFLDEITLYRRDVLESLRGPLEDGLVRIARATGTVSYPCRFSLVAAMNPCLCGYLGDPRRTCRCTRAQLEQYRTRLSGPLLDRFDVQISMARLGKKELLGTTTGESSDAIRARVEAARQLQSARYGTSLVTNASAPKALLEAHVELSEAAKEALGVAIDSLRLSGRGLDRVKRIARTLADLAGGGAVTDEHLTEALFYRSLEDAGAAA